MCYVESLVIFLLIVVLLIVFNNNKCSQQTERYYTIDRSKYPGTKEWREARDRKRLSKQDKALIDYKIKNYVPPPPPQIIVVNDSTGVAKLDHKPHSSATGSNRSSYNLEPPIPVTASLRNDPAYIRDSINSINGINSINSIDSNNRINTYKFNTFDDIKKQFPMYKYDYTSKPGFILISGNYVSIRDMLSKNYS